jgi:hypothetical protein
MRETVEFRIPEKHAQRYLKPDQGEHLSSATRALTVEVSDPLYQEIGRVYARLREQDEYFYHGWIIRRSYSAQEVATAELFHLTISSVFEPPGEECGTVYEESTACVLCGAGRRQVSDLVLDLRKAPKSRDIARTIADEWIVSQRLAELLIDWRVTGFALHPVRHKARYQDDPIELETLPAGREILQRAHMVGVAHPTGEFWVWYNRPEQLELREQLEVEHVQRWRGKDKRMYRPVPVWYQLTVTSQQVEVIQPTRFGVKPHDESADFRCPLGHVSGLNLLSEVWVKRESWDGSDVSRTAQMVGHREGVLTPAPLLLISPRLQRLFKQEMIKGYNAEVAHLV